MSGGYVSDTGAGSMSCRDRRNPYFRALARQLDGLDVRSFCISETTHLTHNNSNHEGMAEGLLKVFGPVDALLRHGLIQQRHVQNLPRSARKFFRKEGLSIAQRKTGLNVYLAIDEDRLLEWFGSHTFAPLWRRITGAATPL